MSVGNSLFKIQDNKMMSYLRRETGYLIVNYTGREQSLIGSADTEILSFRQTSFYFGNQYILQSKMSPIS